MSLHHTDHTTPSHSDDFVCDRHDPSPPHQSTLHAPAYEFNWAPKRSVGECNRILTAPGRLHEMEHVVIDGRVTRVYKNLPPNIRAFWLDRSAVWRDRDYIVFENERYTYGQVAERASKLASLLYTKYAVRKGDRVAIIMRNYPEFMIAFWAIHLIGGVAAMVNAWAPHGPLLHCIVNTNPKVIIVDPERADRLCTDGLLNEARAKSSALYKVFVVRSSRAGGGSGNARRWKSAGITPLESALDNYTGPVDAWRSLPSQPPNKESPDTNASTSPLRAGPLPDDNATIFFTSGTTGLPKGVLSSQRGFLTNVLNMFVGKMRASLRKGEDIPTITKEELESLPQKGSLISVPLFHVTGLTSGAMSATSLGGKMVFMHKWDKEAAARIIKRERLTSAGGVPSMIMDLIESSLDGSGSGSSLESLNCGGAPNPETMSKEVARRFGIECGQGYGLSETNALAVGIQGEDFLLRPSSTGLAMPVTDLIVVDPATQKVLPPGQVGELWIKGSNLMKGYWGDKEATEKTITRDGWFKSGDMAYIDEEGFVFIKDRIKDIIIRGGENIHSTEVENALYANEHILDAAAVSVPDPRLGELVAAVVASKPHYKGLVTEEEIIEGTRKLLPSHAVPVMVLVQDDLIERNANGKIVKDALRIRVRREWARRLKLRNRNDNSQGRMKARAKL